MLLTEDEARHALELDDRYVIVPAVPVLAARETDAAAAAAGGLPLRLATRTTRWLSVEELRTLALPAGDAFLTPALNLGPLQPIRTGRHPPP